MSTHAVEMVLYDLGVRREARAAFSDDATAFLSRYSLQTGEAGAISSFDVNALQSAGVSPLLTYGFWMMNAPVKTRATYLDKLRQKT